LISSPASLTDLRPWARDADDVLRDLEVNPEQGLDARAVSDRRRRWGPNEVDVARRRSVASILLAQFRGVVVALLVSAAALAFLFSDFVEGVAIFAVVLINGAISFMTEWRAVRSMEALRQFARVDCVAMRSGTATTIPAADLVPGDIVLLDAGDIVPADIRLVEAAKLAADESTLTGESLPVRKRTETLGEDTPILDRHNMAFKGTSITRGSGHGVVVGTGTATELGKISTQVAEAESHLTPLEKRLNALAVRLAWAVIWMAVVIAVIGVLAGRETFLAIEVAIALAVAAIPEGLAIVATIALARGMWRMAQRNALITRLSAVETLGATNVILTDKTGTLTENRMAVTTVLLESATVDVDHAQDHGRAEFQVDGQAMDAEDIAVLDEALRMACLCSNASLSAADDGTVEAVGDPTELALLMAASGRGIRRDELLREWPEVHEEPFDPDTKRMATVHEHGDGGLVAVKGAPEAVVPACTAALGREGEMPLGDTHRDEWLARAERLAHRGLRMLAIAGKQESDGGVFDNLVLLGIVGLEDPAREGIPEAIGRCRAASIAVVMVTGDHAATARNIAIETGIVDEDAAPGAFLGGEDVDALLEAGRHDELLRARVLSRVTPEQKLRLIDLYQQGDNVVAMTGDGVNDAPALKKADIGVAMGERGTAVAREAAAMVLQDDEFSTIVAAVEHGRAIFQNIRKFVIYLLSCNSSEVLVVSLATLSGAPLPLLPLQILFLNLVTDVFPALALGVGEGSPSLMRRRPRPAGEKILTRAHWREIAAYGGVMAVVVLVAMAIAIYGLGYDLSRAVTVTFCTLALAQLWHVFNMRDDMRRIIDNEIVSNPWVWAAFVLCLMLIVVAVYVPVLAEVLALSAPDARGWLLIIVASLVPLVVGPVVRAVTH
jgi:Ca2+-transporting ATPase